MKREGDQPLGLNIKKLHLEQIRLQADHLQAQGLILYPHQLRLLLQIEKALEALGTTTVNQEKNEDVDGVEDDLDQELELEQPIYRPENLPPSGTVVGLSLSFCVLDIARGLVPYNRIDKIITSTNFNPLDPNEVAQINRSYGDSYWKGDLKVQCFEILDRLIADKKIRQPRREGMPMTHIARGRWLLSTDMQDENDYPKLR